MGYRGMGLSMEPLYVMLHQDITQAVKYGTYAPHRSNMSTCKVAPLSVGFRAAGVLGGVIGRWRNRGDKLLKVHDVGQEGVLRSGAFRIDRTRAMRRQLQGGNESYHQGAEFYKRCIPG